MKEVDYSTDTHLAKKYNDLLYDSMLRCNTTGYVNNSIPHYDNLMGYYGAVNMLFINTFVLFEIVNVSVVKDGLKKEIPISKALEDWSLEIEDEIRLMKTNPAARSPANFAATFDKCKRVHKLIMYGLQKRNMLVRMSQAEPRGEESIDYWNTKTAFRKGAVRGDDQI